MAGYTRQSAATIISGADITAAIFNAEFNQLQSAFHATTGHAHNGASGNGPKLVLTAAAAVSGILPLANGGTGYSTRIEAYDNLHVVGSDIAVGSTVDLNAADGDYIEITGTGGTITSFGTGDVGVKRTLYFSGASNTITHNGTSLICPNGVNMTVLAGEQIVVRSLGSGNWIIELHLKKSVAALGNLTLAANKLPYMSSTTAMSLADLTTFGRSLIDDTDAATARTTLGLGTISTQDSNNVSISGGAITGITDLAVADGGTGASTAANARTNLGLVIGTDVQAYDSGLAALAAFNTNGLLVQTANNTFVGRTLTGPAAGISVSNGDGVSDNPTLSLANDLSALEGLASTGIAARTGSDAWSVRTITGTANKITVTNGSGVSGDPTITIPDAVTLVTPTVTGTLTAQALVDISASGAGQIKFPATQNASSDANTLDDYEEGTWTPTLNAATTNFTSVTYDGATTGNYTKIGNVVTVTGRVRTDAVTKGAAAGPIYIGGIPFANAIADVAGSIGFAIIWLANHPRGCLVIGSTGIFLYSTATATGAYMASAPTDVGTGANANDVYFSATYITST